MMTQEELATLRIQIGHHKGVSNVVAISVERMESLFGIIDAQAAKIAGLTAAVATIAPGAELASGLPAATVAPAGWRPVPVSRLQNLLCLIDPPPVDLPNGKVMVFRNPNAADVLARISAEVRAMLDAVPRGAGDFKTWDAGAHEWWLSHVEKKGGNP